MNDDNNVVGMITRKDLLHEVCEQKYHERQEEAKYEKEREREERESKVSLHSRESLERIMKPADV